MGELPDYTELCPRRKYSSGTLFIMIFIYYPHKTMHCYHLISFYGMFLRDSNVQQVLVAEHNVGAGYIFLSFCCLCSVPATLAKVLKFYNKSTEVQVKNMAIMILK
jgi:hypothetical protein